MRRTRQTKIIATLAPGSSTANMPDSLVDVAGSLSLPPDVADLLRLQPNDVDPAR